MLADEVPFYVATDERIVEVQGETLKVLKALEAVVGHLRKFLVDHSVLPLFEKSVSLFPVNCLVIYGFFTLYGIVIALQCSFSVCCTSTCLTRSHSWYLARQVLTAYCFSNCNSHWLSSLNVHKEGFSIPRSWNSFGVSTLSHWNFTLWTRSYNFWDSFFRTWSYWCSYCYSG